MAATQATDPWDPTRSARLLLTPTILGSSGYSGIGAPGLNNNSVITDEHRRARTRHGDYRGLEDFVRHGPGQYSLGPPLGTRSITSWAAVPKKITGRFGRPKFREEPNFR